MNEPEFRYGPVARAIFIALLWCTLPLMMAFPDLLFIYLPLLLFLAVGLRPLLVKSGIYQRYSAARQRHSEQRWSKRTEQRRAEVEADKRRARYKNSRAKHPDLPKNW